MKTYVKIDRKLLFEICDAILSSDGTFVYNDCPESCGGEFVRAWDKDLFKKVKNIRNNS